LQSLLDFPIKTYLKTKKNASNSKSFAVLTYHRVNETVPSLQLDTISLSQFKNQLSYLKKFFNVLSMADALRMTNEDCLPPRSVVITFDDGYIDNYELAFPVLKALNLPASFYIPTSGLENGYLWYDQVVTLIEECPLKRWVHHVSPELNDKTHKLDLLNATVSKVKTLKLNERKAYLNKILIDSEAPEPKRCIMSAEQVLDLHRNGFEIGGHTHDHPILSLEDEKSSSQQISMNKDILQNIIDKEIIGFAYPNGQNEDFQQKDIDILNGFGFEYAVTTVRGGNSKDTNPFELYRITPYGADKMRFIKNISDVLF
jgi:peptidoglycan/xylan/chitin deacetylase (PgdA/CDA1 family)